MAKFSLVAEDEQKGLDAVKGSSDIDLTQYLTAVDTLKLKPGTWAKVAIEDGDNVKAERRRFVKAGKVRGVEVTFHSTSTDTLVILRVKPPQNSPAAAPGLVITPPAPPAADVPPAAPNPPAEPPTVPDGKAAKVPA